mmetsp:Transcript_4323/g.12430  ORF Transcript_4323/g.12430 Transcript_4323/m.12430 type:complete len:277 (+) Transcript_4323:163-993(+)
MVAVPNRQIAALVDSVSCLAVYPRAKNRLQNHRHGMSHGRRVHSEHDRTGGLSHQGRRSVPGCRRHVHGRMVDPPQVAGGTHLVRAGTLGLLRSTRHWSGVALPNSVEGFLVADFAAVVIVIVILASAAAKRGRHHARLFLPCGPDPLRHPLGNRRHYLSDPRGAVERGKTSTTRVSRHGKGWRPGPVTPGVSDGSLSLVERDESKQERDRRKIQDHDEATHRSVPIAQDFCFCCRFCCRFRRSGPGCRQGREQERATPGHFFGKSKGRHRRRLQR